MAPFTISPHHPLPIQCRLPQEALFMQSKMSPELLSSKPGTHEDLPLNYYHKTSIMKIRLHLWQVVRRVVNCCMSVAELFCSKMFFFICVGKNMAMTGKLKKCSVEALEREIRDGKDPKMKVIMDLDGEEFIEPAVERESSMMDLDEEEDDETRLSEWESDEETDEEDDEDTEEEGCEPQDVDSEWSDDEDDSEASAESLELWESFLNSSDPYNPLSFCSSIGSRTNTKQNQLPEIKTQPTPATRPEEECHPKPNSKEGGKKVCFSDKVTVHPLVVWSFASRAARDGSCWLQMARDRERFRRRVENIENVIKPCLTPEHRASVWERLQRKTL